MPTFELVVYHKLLSSASAFCCFFYIEIKLKFHEPPRNGFFVEVGWSRRPKQIIQDLNAGVDDIDDLTALLVVELTSKRGGGRTYKLASS